MSREPIGPLMDALGVQIELEESQQVTEVLVIAKVHDFKTGDTAVGMYKSDCTDWVSQLGLLAAAQQIVDGGSIYCPGDDDEC
jgi:hypothetical protein